MAVYIKTEQEHIAPVCMLCVYHRTDVIENDVCTAIFQKDGKPKVINGIGSLYDNKPKWCPLVVMEEQDVLIAEVITTEYLDNKCTSCGAEFSNHYNYCPDCGAKAKYI